MNKSIAAMFMIVGLCTWASPGFNGIFFAPSDVSVGDGRIIASILISAAAILWFMNPQKG